MFFFQNASFIDELYQKFRENPQNVEPSWQYFFSGFEWGQGTISENGDIRVLNLIEAYRTHGHRKAEINPLKTEIEEVQELNLSSFGFQKEDLSKHMPTFGLLKEEKAPLSEIIGFLETTYCKDLGIEYVGLDPKLKKWLQEKIESRSFKIDLWDLFCSILKAEVFETFIHTRYPGQTRFSLEGAETLIPMLEWFLKKAAENEVDETIIGMAHRGRLNVLAHILDKSYFQIFLEFEDTAPIEGSGDVKYHKGAHTTKKFNGKDIHITLVPNPSHLESVDPIVEGQTRAKIELKNNQNKVIPILIHGDASLSGQGVVYELMQMSRLEGYQTGGTIHIILNNQIGYTALPKEGRSTLYCTDIAKAFGAPVFHVNCESPSLCIEMMLLALEIRQKFHVDVFIDLNCYRKHGHNEGDEPTFTQPLEYAKIRSKKTISQLLRKNFSEQQIQNQEALYKKEIETHLKNAIANTRPPSIQHPELHLKYSTPKLSEGILQSLLQTISTFPQKLKVHPKLERILKDRVNPEKLDWGAAEHLAFGSLLQEKIHIRLSGQDVKRGTFSHRHASLIDQSTGESYEPLSHISNDQAKFSIYNSLLSEFAVMGFDLGYSLCYPNSLVFWEAQFGDFVNGSQVIIDQYLATSAQKWAHRSNFTLLLPHGYEGKGPEHSSARMERFLQLCAEDNLIVGNVTTPAQFFHLIRRQAYLEEKRPLIVFTPKVLLRHPLCISSLRECAEGSFEEVKDDIEKKSNGKIVLCSGKIFYDLIEQRSVRNASIALIRVEQLYPFPEKQIVKLIEQYGPSQKIYWAQEEPKNMGAWNYVEPYLRKHFDVSYIGRKESAAPATGSYFIHKQEQQQIMDEIFL